MRSGPISVSLSEPITACTTVIGSLGETGLRTARSSLGVGRMVERGFGGGEEFGLGSAMQAVFDFEE